MHLEDARLHKLRRFAVQSASGGIFIDFDGTLSEIVDVPDRARPVKDASRVLAELASAYRVVAVVSGRSAHELVSWLGSEPEIWGLHGLQSAIAGEVSLAPEAEPFRHLMAAVLREARARIAGAEGLIAEDKEVAVTLHYRSAADPAAPAAVERLAAELASRHGLELVPGKASIELRPPLDFSKKSVVLRRCAEEGLSAACFIGDDSVDMPAFDALDELAAAGATTLRIAVDSVETPRALVARADVVVKGPLGVIALLEELVRLAER